MKVCLLEPRPRRPPSPPNAWHSRYFHPFNLIPTLERVERVKLDAPSGMALPQLALHSILQNPDVSTVFPGIRKVKNLQANVATSDGMRPPRS